MKQPNERHEHFFLTGEGATLGGSMVNLALGMLKLVAGFAGSSSALVADALHSFSDLVTDVVVLFGYKVGRTPEDKSHPYGHGKVESLATVVMGVVLMVVGVGMGFEAWPGSTDTPKVEPGWVAFWAACFSILAKEGLFRWTAKVAETTESKLILANAWHHRSDAFSSIAALVGVTGAKLGFGWMDGVAGLIVSVFIIKVGWALFFRPLQDLLDGSVGDSLLVQMELAIDSVEGVSSQHDLKARRVGADILVDVDIEVMPELTVVQGHDVAREVKRALISGVKGVRDAMVHIEPVGSHSGLFSELGKNNLISLAEALALSTEKVRGLHDMTATPVAGGYLLNLDIELNPSLTLGEAHDISHSVKERLRELEGVADVVVHMDVHDPALD